MYTFATAIGPVGISWNERGVTGVKLGSGRARSGEQPPAWVQDAVIKIVKHLGGELDTLSDIEVDLSAFTAFEQKVYKALRKVNPGKVVTYGGLAKKAGNSNAARAVGSAMRKNPVPLIVPCHRVVRSDGSLGQFSAPAGPSLKRRLLGIEGVSSFR